MEPLDMICRNPGAPELREIVLVQNESAKKAHKGLYAFDDGRYFFSGGEITASIIQLAEKGPDRLHIATAWDDLLRIALWISGSPLIFDVIHLLRKTGTAEAELAPFRKSNPADIFPWLYYGRKFDILRRICNTARASAESKVNRKGLHIYCHLMAEDTGQIIASSL